MRSRLPMALAALAAATAAAFAGAQSQKSGEGYVYAPTTLGARDPVAYVAEPVASVAAGAPNAEQLNPIVEALNAEAGLKGSKLTVVQDGDVVLVTGVTVTREQMKRALEIAGSTGGKVANAITSEQLEIVANPVATPAAAESDSQVIESATPGEPPILPATGAPQEAASRT